jgi:hypothetical protein
MAVFGQELTVAVSPFEVQNGFTCDEAEAIYELFVTGLRSTRKVLVADRNWFDNIMTEMKFQPTDWSDSSKTARLGGALNVCNIIRGAVEETGRSVDHHHKYTGYQHSADTGVFVGPV